MDWREMLRVASAINPSGGAGTTDSPAQVMQQGDNPIRHILDLISGLGKEEGNPPVVPEIPQVPIVSDGPETGGITGNMPTPPYQNPEPPVIGSYPGQEDDPMARIMRMYQPDHEVSDIVKQMVLHPPVRNKPSKLQMILGLTAAGLRQDPELGERTMYKPYYHQLEDYNQRLRPLSILSQMERGDNANERALAIALMRDKTNQDRVDISQQRVTGQLEHYRNQDKISADKVAIQKALEENPNYKPIDGRDGFVWVLDTKSGKQEKTEIPSTAVDALTRLKWQHTYQTEEIRTGGEEDRKTAEARGEQAIKVKETVPGKNTSPTGSKATGPGTGKPMSELEKQRRIRSNYQAIVTKNPELSAEFEFDPNKLPKIKKGTKLTPDQQAEIQRRLRTGVDFPDTKEYWPGQDTTAPGAKLNTKGASLGQPPAKIKVISPDGKPGFIPFEQWPAAEKQGYKKAY